MFYFLIKELFLCACVNVNGIFTFIAVDLTHICRKVPHKISLHKTLGILLEKILTGSSTWMYCNWQQCVTTLQTVKQSITYKIYCTDTRLRAAPSPGNFPEREKYVNFRREFWWLILHLSEPINRRYKYLQVGLIVRTINNLTQFGKLNLDPYNNVLYPWSVLSMQINGWCKI